MSERCGIKGTALKWFRSYLSDRTQVVNINDSYSETRPLKYGVPQGSVLGPILFTIYIAPLGELIEKQGLNRQTFADDNGLYHTISPRDTESKINTIQKVEKCIKLVKDFLLKNKLKINDDKTIFMLLGSTFWLNRLNLDSLKVGDTEIKPVNSTHNLGVILDKEMTFKDHVNGVFTCGAKNSTCYSWGYFI
jgi:hypothetical protein